MMVDPVRELLGHWYNEQLNVLVPKRRGSGYLKVPFGHHADVGLSDISMDMRTDIYGLDGALEFQYNMGNYRPDEQRAFHERAMPMLSKHYGVPYRMVDYAEFKDNHPLGRFMEIRI